MQQQVQKWGNSLAIRIPKNLASDSKVTQGSIVDISLKNGRLIVEPVTKKKYSLHKLLSQVTDNNKHSETETGRPVGEEIW